MVYDAMIKTYVKRIEALESNARVIFAVIWGQCSPMMQSKLETLDSFEEKSVQCDCTWILKEIQGITHRFEGTRNIFISLDDAWHQYYILKQGHDETLHDYHKTYQSLLQVLEHYGAVFGTDPPYQSAVRERVTLLAATDTSITSTRLDIMVKSAAKNKFSAIGFLKRADIRRYGTLWTELENSFSRGVDQYPIDLTAAYNLLLNYKPPRTPKSFQQNTKPVTEQATSGDETPDVVSGVTFVQNSRVQTPGNDGRTFEDIKCYQCNKIGHYASSCPTLDSTGVRATPQRDV
jgi:hypothetical protein